jgi:hypothetical protein
VPPSMQHQEKAANMRAVRFPSVLISACSSSCRESGESIPVQPGHVVPGIFLPGACW